jgi:hypothetical protein
LPPCADLPLPLDRVSDDGELGLGERGGRQAPSIPDGASVGPPDFIGVGVQRAGTTWWWALLTGHPEIDIVARRKELHLLERMRDGPVTDEQREWYARQFPRLPGHIAGEWTARYQALPPIGGIITAVAPQAKLLTIVREPVERYRSGLTVWREQSRRTSERRDEKAGKREALMRGFYGRQLQRLIEALGRERILVLQYERCVREPSGELARTLDFLGVAPWAPDQRLLTMHYKQTMGRKVSLSARDEAALVADYEPEVSRLISIVPDIDLSLWPRFSHLARG